jgi:hypothetical protein
MPKIITKARCAYTGCGKLFTPWRGKRFCSPQCRKQEQNRRLGYVRQYENSPQAREIPEGPKPAAQPIENIGTKMEFRQDGPRWEWLSVNEATQKLVDHALPKLHTDPDSRNLPSISYPQIVGWTFHIEPVEDFNAGRGGWYGRVRNESGDISFGPSTSHRARTFVEAYLKGHSIVSADAARSKDDFVKLPGERSWRDEVAAWEKEEAEETDAEI